MDGVGLDGGKGRATALLAAMIAPILTAYAIMVRYAVNVPFIDDYPTVIGFAVRYRRLGSFGARLHYILADQYVEYKLVFVHLLTAAELGLTGRVSVSFLFWVGNLALLPLLYLMWKMIWIDGLSRERRLALFVPVTFYFFSLNYWEAVDWAASSLGYLGTIFFSLLAIYLLADARERSAAWRMTGACGAALIAYAIAANSFLLLPIGLWVLAGRRAWGWAAAWCGVFGLSVVPYFIHFVRDARPGTGSRLLIPLFFVSFVGAGSPFIKLAIPVGVVVLVVLAAALKAGYYRTHRAAMLSVAWLLGSAAMAAVGRGRTGLVFSTSSRYKIYSDLLMIVCYGYVAERMIGSALAERTRRVAYGAVTVMAVLFCARLQMGGARSLGERRARLEAGVEWYREAPGVNSPMYFNEKDADEFFAAQEVAARVDVQAASAMGLYDAPGR